MSRGKHRSLAVALACCCLPGCAARPVDLDPTGLTPEVILSIETESWVHPAKRKRLGSEVRPLAIRDLRCIRPRRKVPDYYSCNYRLDYGIAGIVSGTLRRKGQTIGKDFDGSWGVMLIVTAT